MSTKQNKQVKPIKPIKQNTDIPEEKHVVNPIQWFPGHMAKTRRIISENLSQVDIVLELLDARAVISSRNPDIKKITAGKPVLTLINKSGLADDKVNKKWIDYFKKNGENALLIDCRSSDRSDKSNGGINNIYPEIKNILSEKLERYQSKGMTGRRLRAMIIGIPNVGKSSLLNKLCGNVKAKVEDRPGVTLRKQWVSATIGIDLLDMPGVLWHKFESEKVGLNLAFIGSIKADILDSEENAVKLCGVLRVKYPEELAARFKLDIADIESAEYNNYDIFQKIGQKRGYMITGGEVDGERCAKMLLTEFRAAMIGRMSLEEPGE